MNKLRIRCKKTGKGTEDDSIRPYLDDHLAFKEFHRLLHELRKQGKEIHDITFYIAQVVKETDTDFEVEIIFPDEKHIENNCPRSVVATWQKMKNSLIR